MTLRQLLTRTVIGLFLLGGIATTHGQDAQPVAQDASAAPTPRIEVSPDNFDFGEVWQGTEAKRVFTIKNTGDAPLTIAARSSCGCTVATRPKSPLAAGESTEFSITYDTKRRGRANKKVTLTTNDPQNQRVTIAVQGVVKELFNMEPQSRITFSGLMRDSKETETITLQNLYPEPVKLALKPNQKFEHFDVDFKEVEKGKTYELKVTTKPPLRYGWNREAIMFETGLDAVPTLSVTAAAHAQPRVVANPPTIWIPSRATEATDRYVRVQYRTDSPIEITDVSSDLENIEWKLLDTQNPPTNSNLTYRQLIVTLPPYSEIPNDGGTLKIMTSDKDPEFQTLEVQIRKHVPRRAANDAPTRNVGGRTYRLNPVPVTVDDEGEAPKPERDDDEEGGASEE
jgi:hypothetical protein